MIHDGYELRANEIAQLCEVLPSELRSAPLQFQSGRIDDKLGLNDPRTSRFLYAYRDLSFRWNYARTLALNGLGYPAWMGSRDPEMWKAYLWCIDRERYRDRTMEAALEFMYPHKAKDRAIINALLVCPEATIDNVAKAINVRHSVIAAYERLFFSIMDRREDLLFVSELVFPEGRLAQVMAHAMTNDSLEQLLIRAGYDNGPSDVLYFAGFPKNHVSQMKPDKKVASGAIEALLMANGWILARNGFVNMDHPGISQVRQLMQAEKQAGTTNDTSPFLNHSVRGQSVLANLRRIAQKRQTDKSHRMDKELAALEG